MTVIQPPPNNTAAPRTFSTADLLSQTGREFIMLAGKDGVGKTCAIISIACWVQLVLDANATFFVIDTENKFPTALRSFGREAPTNLVYYKCESIKDVVDAMTDITKRRKVGDWLAVESMGRVWEKAQDMGYLQISGYDKEDYLAKRREQKGMANVKQAPPIPNADQFWNIVKAAHDGAFVDVMVQAESLNVVWSTTINKPPKADAFIKENATRKEVRLEFGIDAGLDGAPRIPYYVETLILLDLVGGKVTARTIRDNNSLKDETRITFDVPDRKSFAPQFWMAAR